MNLWGSFQYAVVQPITRLCCCSANPRDAPDQPENTARLTPYFRVPRHPPPVSRATAEESGPEHRPKTSYSEFTPQQARAPDCNETKGKIHITVSRIGEAALPDVPKQPTTKALA